MDPAAKVSKAGAGALKNIAELSAKKEELEKKLSDVERQIFDLEGSYLEETAQYGNVMRGWEGYLKKDTRSYGGPARGRRCRDDDRLFSRSSTTAPQADDTRGGLGGDRGYDAGAGGRPQREKRRRDVVDDDSGSGSEGEEFGR